MLLHVYTGLATNYIRCSCISYVYTCSVSDLAYSGSDIDGDDDDDKDFVSLLLLYDCNITTCS